jgi:hypothetical protein
MMPPAKLGNQRSRQPRACLLRLHDEAIMPHPAASGKLPVAEAKARQRVIVDYL